MDNPENSQSYQSTSLLQHSPHQVLTAYVLTQMSAASGIKLYGQPAIDAILKEFCQLHDKGVFDPCLASSLTSAQKRASLRAVNLIKQKQTGEIKGRTCANGSVQQHLYDKSQTTSPTVATDALMYTTIIDAKERRDVATADVVGAYLNAEIDTFTVMKLTGETVDIMIQVDNKLSVTRQVVTPAKKDLFEIDESSKRLPKVESEVFHSVVAKLLYVALRARPDILLPVSFLCTRVAISTTQDQLKLLRLLEYLNGT
jgi:hypothetical protein